MELLLNYGLQVAATLLITLIGVLGTYLTLQLGKNANLKNINDAQKELIRAAKITVGELQQTMVSQLKAANSDGKLTPQEIASLRAKLLDKTVEKLSAPQTLSDYLQSRRSNVHHFRAWPHTNALTSACAAGWYRHDGLWNG